MKRLLGRLLCVLASEHALRKARPGDPVHRLLERLSAEWELEVAVTGLGELEASALRSRYGALRALPDAQSPALPGPLAARLAQDPPSALLVIDHPATRVLLGPLRQATDRPIVYVLPEGRPAAPFHGGRFSSRLRAQEDAARQACAATEVWLFDGKGRCPEPAWLRRRLRALVSGGRGARPRPALTSIIIPCRDRLRHTRACLRHVRLNTRGPYEIIAVDNGSRDGTADFLRGQPHVKLVVNRENLGFAKAINQGLARARGRYVVWLNNDALVTPGWLEGLVACAERAPWIGAVGPYTNESVGFQRLDLSLPRDAAGIRRFSQALALKNRGQARPVQRLTGFCLLVKREAVAQVGLLDERFGTACYEDFDYCLRLRLAGYDLALAQDVFVFHHGHQSFEDHDHMLRHARAGREVFLDKWCQQALAFLDEIDPIAARSAASAASRRA